MSVWNLRRLGWLLLFAVAALAAWLLPRRPVVAAPLIGLVGAVAVAQWRAHVAERRLRDAAQRCDVEALRHLATRGSAWARYHAIVALIHHGGFDDAPTSLCVCGECELDTVDVELASMRRIVKLSWTGHGAEAYALASSLGPVAGPRLYREVMTTLRLATRLVSYAAAAHDGPGEEADATEHDLARPEWFDGIFPIVEVLWPSLRWPARLAVAREAAARGELAVARSHLEGMPGWPERSPLERARRDLQAAIGRATAEAS